jgi:hypothetical protein
VSNHFGAAISFNALSARSPAATDGRFLMIRPVGAAAARPSEIVLVQNFFQELESKKKPK